MSESGDVFEERPTADGQEDEVPSAATMRTQPTEPPTVPPEPCLEPRPPVDGAPDADSTPQNKKVPTTNAPQDSPKSVFSHSAPSPFVPPQQQKSHGHVHPAIPSHLHGGPGSRAKISPLLAQSQFAKPASKFHPGGGVQRQGPGAKVTPEQAEEAKLKSKYGKLNKPGGSDFLRMRLNKGGQKYFDSGDYNMAKSKGKISLRVAPKATKPGLPRPIEATTGDTIPTPDSIHHRKTSVQEISKLAV